nr:hypothetical protein [Tanacetum cinerariifolium]
MILESVENGPLIWPTIEENGVTKPKKYSELSATEAIQADCDVKATNIILQGLPPEVYALVSNHKVSKKLWERIQLLMQGTSLTKQEREYIKLVWDLHTTNIDQLHAYLGQHEFHANEIRLMHERNSDPLALVATHHPYGSPYQSQQYSSNQSSTPLSITYPSSDYQSSVHHNAYSPPSSIPQIAYAPTVNQHQQQPKFPSLDSCLTVLVFKQGDDPIDSINHMMSFISGIVTSRYPTTNNQLRNSSNPRQQATINDGRITLQPVQRRQIYFALAAPNSNSSAQQDALILSVIEQLKTQVVNCTKKNLENKSVNDTLTAELERYKEQVKVLKEGQHVALKSTDNVSDSCAQSVEIDLLKQTLSEHLKEKESLMQTLTLLKSFQNPLYLKKAQQLEPKLYDGNVIEKTCAIMIPDSEETLMLAEASRSKMFLKQKDPIILEKKVNITPFDYNSVNSSDPTPSNRPTIVEVLKELPKVSMVNTSLKKLKHHLAGFDVVVKERTTTTTITKGTWGFEHRKACFRDKIIPFVKALKDLFNSFDQYLVDEISKVQNVFHQMEQVVEQHRLESKTFEVKMNKVLNENERLLKQVIRKDIVNIIVNSSVDNTSVLQEKVLVITAIKDALRKLKGKDLADDAVTSHSIDPEMLNVDVEPLNPRLLNNRPAHSDYLKHTQEEAVILREIHSMLNANSKLICVKCNGCMLSDNHDLCVLNVVTARVKSKSVEKNSKRKVWKPTGKVFTNIGYTWRPTGRTFIIVGNMCLLTRITTTIEVPSRKPIDVDTDTPKPVVTLVFEIILSYLDSDCSKHMTGDRPQLTNFVNKFLGTVKFGNDHIAKIMVYGDYHIGNVTISRVYYIEGLGHNLFSVGKFCDSDLEVAFRQHICFICNLDGVNLLTGSRGNNLYTLSLGDMMASSPICLLSKASKTKSWLWHRRPSHLNFGVSFTQGTVSSIPIGGSISPEGFLLLILLLVVIIITVVIVVVILIVDVVIIRVVVVIDGVSSILIVTFPSMLLGVSLGLRFLLVSLVLIACVSRVAAMLSVISHWMVARVMAGVSDVDALDDKLRYPLMIISKDEYLTHLSSGDIVDLIGDEDPTDEDGDTEVSVSLAGRAIITWGGEIALYTCMASIYGSSCKGEKISMSKRYLVKSFEELGELFLGIVEK